MVHREGYHFREGDLLTEPDGWLVSSRRPIRVPPRLPAVARTEGVDPAGIVLHLADVKDDAELTIELKSKEQGKVSVALKDLLSGKHVPILGGSGRVRVITTATPVANAKTEDDFPAACYGPDGTLWVAYVAYHIRDEDRRIEQKPLKMQPENFKAMYTPEFGDQAMVKYYRKGKWSDSFAVTDAKQDIVRCAIAAEGDGNVWVVYSANRNNNHDIFARKLDLNTPAAVSHPAPHMGAEERLTDNPGSDLSPVLCTGPDGSIIGHYQAWNGETGEAAVGYQLRCRSGKWVKDRAFTPEFIQSEWHPAVAAGPTYVAVAHDFPRGGDYDVSAIEFTPGGFGDDRSGNMYQSSSRFEARPALAYDPQGRLWIAYEEGPEQWGKDYGALDAGSGQPALQQPLRPRRLSPGRQALQAGRRAAEFRGQETEPRWRHASQLRTSAALLLSAARPRRQGPPLADLSPEVRHALHARIPAPTG